MNGYWAIGATIVRDGIMRQVPTFYLHENVQGIISEAHACEIARDVIDPFHEHETHIGAVKL